MKLLQLCANRILIYVREKVPLDFKICMSRFGRQSRFTSRPSRVVPCAYSRTSHEIITMPKTRLLNIKKFGTWAGIKKKKKKNNGEAEAVDRDSESLNIDLMII